MNASAYRDNRFTRWVDRTSWRLAGATVCRVFGHRSSVYVWGLCERCFQMGWKRHPKS
jgi:hypothetical protein